MCSYQLIFGFNHIDTIISFVISQADRLVKAGQLEKFMQIDVHLLVTNNGQCHVVWQIKWLIFVKDPLANMV